MVIIWYVFENSMKCKQELNDYIRQHIEKGLLIDAFTFSYDCLKRYLGAWHLEQMPMFPDYIFLESDKPELLIKEVMGAFGKIFKVSKEEEQLLKSLSNVQHNVEMSRGYIRGGSLCVTQGPLRGKEQMIRRIDRHKRIAKLSTVWGKGDFEWTAGLEIISKQ